MHDAAQLYDTSIIPPLLHQAASAGASPSDLDAALHSIRNALREFRAPVGCQGTVQLDSPDGEFNQYETGQHTAVQLTPANKAAQQCSCSWTHVYQRCLAGNRMRYVNHSLGTTLCAWHVMGV